MAVGSQGSRLTTCKRAQALCVSTLGKTKSWGFLLHCRKPMADGGACSWDPFRLPAPDEELTHPFGNGLVVRYGHTSRLVACAVSVVGITTNFPPPTKDPFRLLYFVVSDHMRTNIVVLRAVLKEGLSAPYRPSKALVIDNLETLEVYRKQGLATSLVNFVIGIAEAHGIGLYAYCTLRDLPFWDRRGFEVENAIEMQAACNLRDAFSWKDTVLLRAGKGYTEYLPGDGDRLSSIRPFQHSRYGSAIDPSGGDRCAGEGGGDNLTISETLPHGCGLDVIAPVRRTTEKSFFPSAVGCNGKSQSSVFGANVALPGFGAIGALPPPPPLPVNSSTPPLLTNARLARHDKQEQAKLAVLVSHQGGGGMCAQGVVGAEDTAHERSALARRTATGGWPGFPVQDDCRYRSSSTVGARAGSVVPEDFKREDALKGITAIGSSGGIVNGYSTDLLDHTGEKSGSLASAWLAREKQELKRAIKLSLQDVGGEPPGDETETDEEPGYGAHLSVAEDSLGTAGDSSSQCATPAAVAPTPTIPLPVPPLSGGRRGGAGADVGIVEYPLSTASRSSQQLADAASGAPTAPIENHHGAGRGFSAGNSKECHGENGGGSFYGSGSSENSGDGGVGGRRREMAWRGHKSSNGGFRRLRRRRDEGGASTSGEQSPNGPDGEEDEDRDTEGRGDDSIARGSGQRDDEAGMLQSSSNHQVVGGMDVGRGTGGCRGSGVAFDGSYSGHADPSWINGNGTLPSPPPLPPPTALAPSAAINTEADASLRCQSVVSGLADPRHRGNSSELNSSNDAEGGGIRRGGLSANNASAIGNSKNFLAASENSENICASPAKGSAVRGALTGGEPMSASGGPSSANHSYLDTRLGSAVGAAPAAAAGGDNGRGGGGGGGDPTMSDGGRRYQYPTSSSYNGALPFSNFVASREPLSSNDIGGVGIPCTGSPGSGGGYMSEMESDAYMQAAATGGGLGEEDSGSTGFNNLLAVAEWEHEEADELRRALDASRQTHEEEMLARATQESKADAAAAVTSQAGVGVGTAAQGPRVNGVAPVPVGGVPIPTGGKVGTTPAATGATRGAEVANFNGSNGHIHRSSDHPNGSVSHPPIVDGTSGSGIDGAGTGVLSAGEGLVGGGVGGGDGEVVSGSGWGGGQAAGGGAGGGGMGGSGVVNSAAWCDSPWDDLGDVVGYVGKGKRRCRDR